MEKSRNLFSPTDGHPGQVKETCIQSIHVVGICGIIFDEIKKSLKNIKHFK